MTNYHKKPESERVYVEKSRPCLKCRKPFKSGWAGERVCPSCKSKPSWREGSDLETGWPLTRPG